MSEPSLRVLAVVGSLHAGSITRAVTQFLLGRLDHGDCAHDLLDLRAEPLPIYNPDLAAELPELLPIRKRVQRADVFVLGTPDYHGGMSGALKNFLDYFWHEFAGKLFVTLVASHEKGLTVSEQLRTVARQCNAWALPYGISFADKVDVVDGEVTSEALKYRLGMAARDIQVYGTLLARQRRADLEDSTVGFMARHRPKSEA